MKRRNKARKRGKAIQLLPGFLSIDSLWSGREPLYPSEQSARWALRQHRGALVQGEALALMRGRILVHLERFARVIEVEAIAAMRRREQIAA